MWDRSFAYEVPTSALPIDASGCSSRLPTPSATQNDGHDPEIFLARRERELAKGRNGNGFGLTLGMAAAMLPTPSAWLGRRPENATADPERAASREHDGEGRRGDRSIELPDALAKLLPTPTTQDAANTNGPSQSERNSEPLNVVAPQLLPTPMANPENPGAGGELRAAIQHGEGRRNETGIDSMGRPNRGRPSRLLPTPTGQDARQNALNQTEAERNPYTMWAAMRRLLPTPSTTDANGPRPPDQIVGHRGGGAPRKLNETAANDLSGASTESPSTDGPHSSDGQLPGQLTIEDDSSPDSSSG